MAGPQRALQLLELPDDLLLRIFGHLAFDERLRVAEVCRRLHTLSAAPSELWRDINVQPLRHQAVGVRALRVAIAQFKKWLAPRAAGVEKLTIMCPHTYGTSAQLPSYLLPSVSSMPLLHQLSCQWQGDAALSLRSGPALPALRTLWLSVSRLAVVDKPLLPLPGLDFGLYHGRLDMSDTPAAWVPPGTTQLRLMNMALQSLPRTLPTLAPTLRSLSVDRNGPLDSSSLSLLTPLTRLEALDLGENELQRFPREISTLTRLRILFLHKLFPQDASLAPEDWAALAPLRRLAFLSISSNHLRQLPPAVAGLSQLRGLHIEDNQFREPLPAGAPCWANLVELLLDWGDALRGPSVLTAASRLTRLVLSDHLATLWTPGGGQLVPPAELADALLAAAAAHPSLRLVQDVVEPGQVAGLTPPVARALLHLPRRLPARVELGQLGDTYIGWRLASMPPEVADEESEGDAAAGVAAAGEADL